MLIYNGASTLINMISDGFIFALIGVPLSIRPPCFNCELIKQVTFPSNYHNNNQYHGHLYNRHHHLCMRKIISSASQRAIYSIRLLQAIYNSDVQKIVKRIFLSKAMPRFSECLYKFVSSVRSSSGYHGLLEGSSSSKPLFQIFQILQIRK